MSKQTEFSCLACNYSCFHRGDWKKHIGTNKHKRICGNEILINKIEKTQHVCCCGKEYQYEKNLRRHILSCTKHSQTEETNNLIRDLVRENEKIRNDIKKLNITNQTVVNQTIKHGDYQPQYITAIKDSNVNMQIFLNDTCSQAINLTSFIENLQVNLDDLDDTRERGLAFSLGRVLLRGLKELEFNKRPIHCADLRKSEMYVRDNDTWDVDHKELRIRNAIGILSAKQIAQIHDWESKNPNWTTTEKGKEVYSEMVRNVLLTTTELERERVENNVIRTIAKETLLTETTN